MWKKIDLANFALACIKESIESTDIIEWNINEVLKIQEDGF